MKNRRFDRLLADIRGETIDESLVRQAAGRVLPQLVPDRPTAAQEGPIHGCAGFQALLPAYAAGTLPQPKALLVEDHLRHCLACRKMSTGAPVRLKVETRAGASPARTRSWAIAASLALVAGLTAVVVAMLGPGNGPRGVVQSVDGAIYRVSAEGLVPVSAGTAVFQDERFRTAKATDAVLRLTDGSLIEVSDRSDLSISRGWRGTTVNLGRGNIIVQAAHQRTGHLYVSAGDSLVSVKGTIFAVSRGTKGSRVSVLQGDVQVVQNRATELLRAGEQATSSAALEKIPVARQISWSRNSAKYLALLGEFRALGKQIEAIPSPSLRYESKLAAYVPPDAVIYAAIPNIATTLAQAEQLLEDRMQQSSVLREWWTTARGAEIHQVMEKVRALSGYLGNEIVLAIPPDASGQLHGAPVILAEAPNPAVADYLAAEFKGGPQYELKNGILAMSPQKASLAKAEASILQPGAFLKTPFYRQIVQSYQDGAGWLFCANMEQILKRSVAPKEMRAAFQTGLSNVGYLVVERRQKDGRTQNEASLTFSDGRQGIVAWLAPPAPMGSLDFVSPNAVFAASFVVKNPASALSELLAGIESRNPKAAAQLASFQSATGVDLVNDLAGPLGGDFTIAVDGALLPTPSWKLAVEVYDPQRLESTIERLIDAWNQIGPGTRGDTLTFTKGTYNTIRGAKLPFEIDYTFNNGYLIAAPSTAVLETAISNRASGITLASSQTFQSLLPSDGYTNFSGLLYQNAGTALSLLASQVKSLGAPDALTQNVAPSLIYAYGEPDRIVVASNGSFFGLGLDALVGGGGTAFLLPRILHDIRTKNQTQ